MDYRKVASQVIKAVGGKENIVSITHCITRLRFVLKNGEVPQKEEVEKIDGVAKFLVKGGQHQAIIGNQVEYVYDEAVKIFNGEVQPIEESEPVKQSEKELFQEEIVRPSKKSNSSSLGILIAILLILVVIGGAVYFFLLK